MREGRCTSYLNARHGNFGAGTKMEPVISATWLDEHSAENVDRPFINRMTQQSTAFVT